MPLWGGLVLVPPQHHILGTDVEGWGMGSSTSSLTMTRKGSADPDMVKSAFPYAVDPKELARSGGRGQRLSHPCLVLLEELLGSLVHMGRRQLSSPSLYWTILLRGEMEGSYHFQRWGWIGAARGQWWWKTWAERPLDHVSFSFLLETERIAPLILETRQGQNSFLYLLCLSVFVFLFLSPFLFVLSLSL